MGTRDEIIALEKDVDRWSATHSANSVRTRTLMYRLLDAVKALSTPAPVSEQNIARRLVEWHDARYVKNMGEPFSAIVDDARREIAMPPAPVEQRISTRCRSCGSSTLCEPSDRTVTATYVHAAPVAAPPADLVAREREAIADYILSCREDDTDRPIVQVFDVLARHVRARAFPLPEVPDER